MSGSPDPIRRHWCRGCRHETRQLLSGSENSSKPLVAYYRCSSCGLVLTTYANVLDAEGLCLTLTDHWLRGKAVQEYGDVRSIDRADLHSHMMLTLWQLYLEWKPELGSFLGYASAYLVRRGAIEWMRQEKGRTSPKAHAVAVSLDAPPDHGDLSASSSRAWLEVAGDSADAPTRGDRLGGAAAEGAGGVCADSDAALRRVFAETSGRLARQNRGLGLSGAGLLA